MLYWGISLEMEANMETNRIKTEGMTVEVSPFFKNQHPEIDIFHVAPEDIEELKKLGYLVQEKEGLKDGKPHVYRGIKVLAVVSFYEE